MSSSSSIVHTSTRSPDLWAATHQSAGDDPDALVGFGWLQGLEGCSVEAAG